MLRLRARYPARASFRRDAVEEEHEIGENLLYLEEHGLCDSGVQVGCDNYVELRSARITAAGIDFLADDGDLSALLSVVTVRLHADTIRDLIAAKIETAVMPPAEKASLLKSLKALPQGALEAATTDLVRTGLDHLPNAAEWLRQIVGL